MTEPMKDLGFTLKPAPKTLKVTSNRPYLIVEGNAKVGTYLSVCIDYATGHLDSDPSGDPTELTLVVIRLLQRVASDDDVALDTMMYDPTDKVFRARKLAMPVCKGLSPPYLAYEMLRKSSFWDTLAAQLQELLNLKEAPTTLAEDMEMIMEDLIESSRTELVPIPAFKFL